VLAYVEFGNGALALIRQASLFCFIGIKNLKKPLNPLIRAGDLILKKSFT
jgi:hypothetical protein